MRGGRISRDARRSGGTGVRTRISVADLAASGRVGGALTRVDRVDVQRAGDVAGRRHHRLDASGGPIAVGTPRSSADGRTVTVPVGGQVTGAVEVRLRVIGDDGDLVDGAFGFGVGSAAPMPRRGAGRWPLAPTLRWLLLLGLAGALGTAVLSLVLPAAAGAQPPAFLRRLSAASGLLVVAAVAASSYPLLAASGLTTSRAGRFALVEFVAAATGVLLTLATRWPVLPAA
ncbi:MAG: hypothetical protein ABIM89_13385, partial [Mycobacteriales bacterium]